MPEVENTYTFLDGNAGAATEGTLFIILSDRSERDRNSYAVQLALRPVLAGLPNYRVTAVNDSGSSQGSDITIQFVGQNPESVNAAAMQLVNAARQLPQLGDVRSSAALQRPELQIRPRPEDLARLGVTSADLASAVRIATSGDIEQNLARYDLPDRQIPIRVLLRPDSRSDLDAFRRDQTRRITELVKASGVDLK